MKLLEAGEEVWYALWDQLLHQGDLGEASYAAVPHLVRIGKSAHTRDWNLYALVAQIEIERLNKSNAQISNLFQSDYDNAWCEIAALALEDLETATDPLLVQSALSVIALAKSERKLGALLAYFDASQIDELAEEMLGWSESYD